MIDFTVLVLEGAFPTSVAATIDILSAAAMLAPQAGVAAPRWRVWSPGGGAVRLQGGLSVATSKLPARRGADRSTWVLPGLGVERADAIAARLARDDALQAAAAIAGHVKAEGRIAASCSSVFLLEAAGVLHGRRVTTSWWLAPTLRRHGAGCIVDADRMVCADGPVVRAGARVLPVRAHAGAPPATRHRQEHDGPAAKRQAAARACLARIEPDDG